MHRAVHIIAVKLQQEQGVGKLQTMATYTHQEEQTGAKKRRRAIKEEKETEIAPKPSKTDEAMQQLLLCGQANTVPAAMLTRFRATRDCGGLDAARTLAAACFDCAMQLRWGTVRGGLLQLSLIRGTI